MSAGERSVDFFFSPGSRYCYLAASQLPALERDLGCRVDWRPVSGIALRALRGADPFAGAPVSGQYDRDYRRRDAEAWADYYGIPFREPPTFEFDFDLLCRAAMAGRLLGRAAELGARLCAQVYGSGTWPIDEEVCLGLAAEVGLDRAAFGEQLHSTAVGEALDASAAEAHRRGAFGVPSFFLGARLFWGNDRLPLLRRALGG